MGERPFVRRAVAVIRTEARRLLDPPVCAFNRK
jgi:hypothetical protein